MHKFSTKSPELVSHSGLLSQVRYFFLKRKKKIEIIEKDYKNLLKIDFMINPFRLLHAQAAYCEFRGAAETRELAVETVEKLKKAGCDGANHAALYAEFSVLFFIRSEYDLAYRYVEFCHSKRGHQF